MFVVILLLKQVIHKLRWHIQATVSETLLEFSVDESLMFQLGVNASCVRLSATLTCQHL